MAPILYKRNLSAPCRAIMMISKALDLEMECKEVDLSNKDNIDPEFLEINPQHTIPTLNDDGFALIDSHAIGTYLVGKYASDDDSLYPSDVQMRALIDSKMYFNCGTLQNLAKSIVVPIFYQGETSIPEQLVDKVNEAYGLLESSLEDRDWLIGESVTLADLSIIPSITTLNLMVPIDADSFPKLTEYIARAEELPYYDANSEGLEEFKAHYESFMV